MAFNPFDVFRRNQRILFAFLTVVIMFMFVLSSGIGGKADFFDWLPAVLARKAHSGDELATVNGDAVYASDLDKIDVNRTLANEYMANAALIATNKLAEAVRTQADKAGPDARPVFQQLITTRPLYIDQRMMQMAGQFPPEFLQQFQQRTIEQLRTQLTGIATGPDAKAEDKSTAELALKLIDFDQRQQYYSNDMYFLNMGNQTRRSRMDFLLWRMKADELGIVFTNDDTELLISGEFDNRLEKNDWLEVEKRMDQKIGYTPESVRAAIADEFRVRMAQTAVMGEAYTNPFTTAQLYDAPYDYFEFYKDQLSDSRYGVITVPAENFVSQVTGEPSESELLQLFKKYARKEPSPFEATPGFKEPRRLKVGWLEVTGKEPYYQDKADKIFPQSGTMPVELAAIVGGVSTSPEPLLQTAYGQYADVADKKTETEWFVTAGSPFGKSSLIDDSVVRPQTLAASAAAAAGSMLTVGTPFNAALTLEQTAITLEFASRAQALGALLSPPLVVGDRIGAAAAFAARIPGPLPLAVVQPQLVEQVRTSLAYQLAADDLREFQQELGKLGADLSKSGADATAARGYVDKFVKDRNLATGETEAFRDQFSIGDAPALAPLKPKAAGPHGGNIDAIQFGRRFFYTTSPDGRREMATEGLFQPEPYPTQFLSGPTESEPATLVWRTAEIEADAPKSLEAKGVREKVIAAWKFGKAKELARKAADDLAEKAKNLGDNRTVIGQKLRDLESGLKGQFEDPAAKARVNYFEIDDVAPLVDKALPAAGQRSVSEFTITRNDNIPYPSQAMSDQLVENRDKPLSTPVVAANRPEDVYYVAVLMDRNYRDAGTFGRSVLTAPAVFGNEVATAVSQRHQNQLYLEARRQAIELLEIEFEYANETPAMTDGSTSN